MVRPKSSWTTFGSNLSTSHSSKHSSSTRYRPDNNYKQHRRAALVLYLFAWMPGSSPPPPPRAASPATTPKMRLRVDLGRDPLSSRRLLVPFDGSSTVNQLARQVLFFSRAGWVGSPVGCRVFCSLSLSLCRFSAPLAFLPLCFGSALCTDAGMLKRGFVFEACVDVLTCNVVRESLLLFHFFFGSPQERRMR